MSAPTRSRVVVEWLARDSGVNNLQWYLLFVLVVANFVFVLARFLT